jgi:hypothetical protein
VARRSRPVQPQRTPEQHADLRRRAEAGDVDALGELVYLHHDIDDLAIDPGDLAASAEHDLIVQAEGTMQAQADIARYLAKMRTDLDGPNPSALERLLVDCVVTLWLHVAYLERCWARALRKGGPTLKDMDRMLDRANRRYLAAAKTLASVRRMALPVVQMNLARQQVNVVTGSAGAAQFPPS